MNRWITPLIICTVLLGGNASYAQEKEEKEDGPSVEEQMAKIADLGPGVRDENFHWARVELDRLLTMKMIVNRAHDHVHVMDLYRSGAIDRTCIDRVPAHLRMPLKDVLDRCDREYGNSPH